MKNVPSSPSRLLPLLVIINLAGSSLVQAQTFSGSDNFNDSTLTVGLTERWRYNGPLTGADDPAPAFGETGGTLQFTSSASLSTNRHVMIWISPSTSGGAYAYDWTASITVTNTTTPSAGYTLAGMEIYTLTDVGTVESPSVINSGYYGIYLNANSSGVGVQTEWGKYNPTLEDFARDSVFAATSDTTDVTFRASFDAASKELEFAYSFDGVSFTTGATFDVDGAEAGLGSPWLNGFGIELLGGTFANAGTVAAGKIIFDNMVVSAIPEPSTYAALVGVGALGLALWRGRRRSAA